VPVPAATRLLAVFGAAAILAAAAPVRSQAVADAATARSPAAGVEVLAHLRRIVVDREGHFVEEIEDRRRPLDADSVDAVVQRALPWNASTGRMELLEAATIKRDGRRIDVPPELLREGRQDDGSQAGMFQDRRYKLLTFLEVEPGDTVVIRARHHRDVAPFPGHFFDARHALPEGVRDQRIDYELPAEMPAYLDGQGFTLEAIEHDGDRVRYRWRHTGHRLPVDEPRAVSPFDYADRLFVSSIGDFRALAHEYLRRAAGQPDPTPEIRALALGLVKEARTTRAKAERIHGWIRQNLRFGGSSTGIGAVVPRFASEVLAHREGDCKDHAVLFESMLSSVGISSSPAMVNAGNAYRLPSIATLGVFNHVITWVPELQLFVDCSSHKVAFGQLPTMVSGKPALIVKTGEIRRTPPQGPLAHSVELRVDVAEDASAGFAQVDTARGWLAESRRHFFRDANAETLEVAAQQLVDATGVQGQARLSVVRERGPEDTHAMRLEGRIARIVGGTQVPWAPSLTAVGAGLGTALYDFLATPLPTVDSVCLGLHIDERATWTLPAGLAVARLPRNDSVSADGFSYRSEHAADGRRITSRRSLRLDFDGNVCSPAGVMLARVLAARVLADLEWPLTLQSTRRAATGQPTARAGRAAEPARVSGDGAR
jgi:transglutaminase-like putative cysteine protease